jgi:tetratricopeptide (TPR) repeat protein/predicted GH43/DUF377 family glycosyl hydrolase
MIVRDEAAVIERCLASVRPHIDAWVICDTGSVDDTPDRVRSALAGIPGELHHRRWIDFGTNRTELLALARAAAHYLLLLDADHTLRVEAPLPELAADAYLIRHAGTLDYAVPRLVRGHRRWWYEGSTHEYLATEGTFVQELLPDLIVEDHADGSSRAEKLERDRRLLERDLKHDPENARAAFYLAQTCRELGREERALELYGRRVELGGWDEEVFYAAYQRGVLLAERHPEEGLGPLEEAWRRRPSRAEPLYELARLCRFLGRHDEAHAFAERGLALAYPDDLLFVHRPVYEWGLRFERAVAAYWLGRFDEALADNDLLLAQGGLPPDVEAAVRENRSYCITALERSGKRVARREPGGGELLAALAPSVRIGEIRLEVEPAWPQFNPTIAADGDGFRLIVRTANYVLENGHYRFLDNSRAIRTLNYLVDLDRSLAVADVGPLVDSAPEPRVAAAEVQGHEDCRLVGAGGRWFASATVRDRNGDGLCEIALLTLEGNEISSSRVLAGPTPGRHEKNWMPFVDADCLHFLYRCAPTIVLRCDRDGATVAPISSEDAPSPADGFRGGSQGLAVPEGFLFVVHEAIDGGGGRAYTHRFVLLDEDFRLRAFSPQFRFATTGVEFCAGLAAQGRSLLLSFGVADRAAALAVVDAGEALALLDDV